MVHGYPGLSWTWGALALSCLVCAGLGRLRFGVPKPGLGVPRSVLDMGLSDHRLSGQEHGVPGVVLDLGFTHLSLGGPGAVLDLESARLGVLCGWGWEWGWDVGPLGMRLSGGWLFGGRHCVKSSAANCCHQTKHLQFIIFNDITAHQNLK